MRGAMERTEKMTVLIVGVGLIGGSFAVALRDRAPAGEILGVDASAEHGAEALARGLVDRMVALEEGIARADLVVLATPADTLPRLAVQVLDRATDRQVVMDMGSLKAELCAAVAGHVRRSRFVAVHPMWGTEHSGPAAAEHGAFAGRIAVVCERGRSAPDAVRLVERIFAALGAPIVEMEPEAHDRHAAYVSHISHVTSFALALSDLAGGGFESTVRLAKSAASTWVPILLGNKTNLLDVLGEHIRQLERMRRMIECDDAEGLAEAMRRANEIRRILH